MGAGKRAGSRRGSRSPARVRADVVGYAAAILASASLWGYLVFLAIRWGAAARADSGPGWVAFAAAAVAAVACLFVGLLLVSRLSRALGLTATQQHHH